jgi:hypothetical protein
MNLHVLPHIGGMELHEVRPRHLLKCALVQQPAEAQAGFRTIQIKQKFGRLRVYLSTTATPEMRAAIDEAEEESIATCEVCSAPGQLADRNGWTSVKCAAHENWSRLEAVFQVCGALASTPWSPAEPR